MSAIVFEVIDNNCQAADDSFFPPHIALTTKSTTQIATLLGFSEFEAFASKPPKKYRRITWSGSAEQNLFAGTAQIAGARLDWSGSSEIDLQGNYTSTYTKLLSEMCTAADKLCMGISGTPAANVGVAGYNIIGWIGSAGHMKCPGTGLPLTPVGDVAIKQGQLATIDSASQQHLTTGIVFGNNGAFVAYTDGFTPSSATQGADVNAGQQNNLVVAADPLACGTLVNFADYLHPPLGFTASLVWNNNYSVFMDEEYTDAIALANAQVIVGNGATAQNNPRTTGFVSNFTNVVFTLTASNLLLGHDYTMFVDLADLTAGTVTTNSYLFSADNTGQRVIIDSIPVPTPGHSVQVRNPRIQFTT